MTASIETYLGKVTFNSQKVPIEKDLDDFTDKAERIRMQQRFFPIEFNEVDAIEFYPRKEAWETMEYRQCLIQFLKNEGFLGGEGNFIVQTLSCKAA